MGYRSEVTIAFYDGRASRGWEVLDMLKERFPMLFDHWPEGYWECGRDIGSPAVFRAEDVKWYTDDPCFHNVRIMMEALKELADDTDTKPCIDCMHWEFARIGEDVSDTEYLTSPHAANHIRIERYAQVHMTLG